MSDVKMFVENAETLGRDESAVRCNDVSRLSQQ